MRQVTRTSVGAVTQTHPGGLWTVEFDDHSIIAVDVSHAVHSQEKTMERIESAAVKYSESHPTGVLTSTVVNLSGQKIN
jgi:hypothetical protein